MLLLIDAGNTRLKWALAPLALTPDLAPAPAVAPLAAGDASAGPQAAADAGAGQQAGDWLAEGAVFHAEVDGLGAIWARHPVAAVLISNVAGAALAAQLAAELAAVRSADGAMPPVRWFASAAEVAGVRNGYRDPEKLGCDRLAALVGARALMPGRNLIVATCGTATTVDALRADGRFIGGMILPGLATMARALAQGTAQLPTLADSPATMAPPALFADHTAAAIRSGCLAAQAGAIERAVAAHGNAHCLLSGGAAAWVSPALQAPHAVRDNLVLIGLQVIALAQPEGFTARQSRNHETDASKRPEANRTC